jgi:hypothetical protein
MMEKNTEPTNSMKRFFNLGYSPGLKNSTKAFYIQRKGQEF